MKLPSIKGPSTYGDVLLIQAMNRDLEVPNVHMRPQTVGSLHLDPTKSCKVAVVTLRVGPHGVPKGLCMLSGICRVAIGFVMLPVGAVVTGLCRISCNSTALSTVGLQAGPQYKSKHVLSAGLWYQSEIKQRCRTS